MKARRKQHARSRIECRSRGKDVVDEKQAPRRLRLRVGGRLELMLGLGRQLGLGLGLGLHRFSGREKRARVVSTLHSPKTTLVGPRVLDERRQQAQARPSGQLASNELHVIKAAPPECPFISRNPTECVCPTPPLKGYGIRKQRSEHRCQTPLSAIFVGNDKASGKLGELKGTTCLGKRKVCFLVEGRALGTNEFAGRRPTAGAGKGLIDTWQALPAPLAQ
jgi:hypothetical protein